jgi:hypothetical protein
MHMILKKKKTWSTLDLTINTLHTCDFALITTFHSAKVYFQRKYNGHHKGVRVSNIFHSILYYVMDVIKSHLNSDLSLIFVVIKMLLP